MLTEVEKAIELIKDSFAAHKVDVIEEPQGGAYVIVHDIPIGDRYVHPTSWIGFLITFQYPEADVYPHFVRSDLQRKDGKALEAPFSGPIDWQNRQAIQISRKSNRMKASTDHALTKLFKVIEWLKTHE